MEFYWYILLAVVFFNVLFSLVSVDVFAHSVANGGFDLFTLVLTSLFVMVLCFIFMYMLARADKVY